MRSASVALMGCLVSCYSGVDVSKDINRAWVGRSSASLEAQWGKADGREASEAGTTLVWQIHHRHIRRLPSAQGSLRIDERGIDAFGAFQPGEIETYTTAMTATVDSHGTVVAMQGPSIRWGAPRGTNLRHGALFGLFAGAGAVDDASSPVPSLGAYVGGMLSQTVGLVGTFTWANGSDDDGYAMGFAWGMAPIWWPEERLSVRVGPAMILGLDPGLENPSIEPGVDASASYAFLRSGSFVSDLRLSVVAGTETVFGVFGLGVNVN